jgi:predicted small lipoprotein YifL
MRILTLLSATAVTLCLTTFLTGCGDAGPMDLDEPPAPAEVLSQQNPSLALINGGKPHRVEQVSSGDLWPIGWCDQGAGVPRMSIQGSGNATVVGRFRLTKTMCMNPTTGEVTEGESVLTAANGDEIHMTFQGQGRPDPGPPTLDLEYIISGGTGRFLNAVGELQIETILTSESTWTSIGGGWIVYDASDRSGR